VAPLILYVTGTQVEHGILPEASLYLPALQLSHFESATSVNDPYTSISATFMYSPEFCDKKKYLPLSLQLKSLYPENHVSCMVHIVESGPGSNASGDSIDRTTAIV
jgi:hypothetical protein